MIREEVYKHFLKPWWADSFYSEEDPSWYPHVYVTVHLWAPVLRVFLRKHALELLDKKPAIALFRIKYEWRVLNKKITLYQIDI